MRFPVSQPDLSGNEERYVVEALRSSWISSRGEFLDRFEREFAAMCGTHYAIATTSGTTALHLAMLALDVRPGDEVLVPSLTYVATANAVRYVGAEPVFVDVDPATWCIDPQLIESKITRRTRGIIPVHLYGHPADMDTINRLAAVHGLWVVEDAAEALFARYKDRPVGGLGRIGVFSFYGNKILTSGEGGAVVTNDAQLDLRLRTLRGQGVDPNRRYFFPVTGYNFRMTNVQAAILCAQLERGDGILAERMRVYGRYEGGLRDTAQIRFQPRAAWAQIAPWLFSIVCTGNARDQLAVRLLECGIETRPFFVPLHVLPMFRAEGRACRDELPVTEALAAGGLNLPTYPALSNDDVDEICLAVRRSV